MGLSSDVGLAAGAGKALSGVAVPGSSRAARGNKTADPKLIEVMMLAVNGVVRKAKLQVVDSLGWVIYWLPKE